MPGKRKLLGIPRDNGLKFDSHIEHFCKKISRKLSVLLRVGPYLSFKRSKTLMTSFIQGPLPYCPLICMLHSRRIKSFLNHSIKGHFVLCIMNITQLLLQNNYYYTFLPLKNVESYKPSLPLNV